MNHDPWEYSVIDAYKPLEDDSDWLACPDCGMKPRIWEFDNGRFAKCACDHKYDPAPVRAKDTMTHHREFDGDFTNYDHDELRNNWNKYIEEKGK